MNVKLNVDLRMRVIHKDSDRAALLRARITAQGDRNLPADKYSRAPESAAMGSAHPLKG